MFSLCGLLRRIKGSFLGSGTEGLGAGRWPPAGRRQERGAERRWGSGSWTVKQDLRTGLGWI